MSRAFFRKKLPIPVLPTCESKPRRGISFKATRYGHLKSPEMSMPRSTETGATTALAHMLVRYVPKPLPTDQEVKSTFPMDSYVVTFRTVKIRFCQPSGFERPQVISGDKPPVTFSGARRN